MPRGRRLLVTMTGEPVQPVRLYYQIPNHRFVAKRLRAEKSVNDIPELKQFEWLYCARTRHLTLGPRSYDEVPEHVQPIVIGRIRLPDQKTMRIDVRSTTRAVEAARFFKPILGKTVVPMQARILNRLSDESMGPLDEIDAELDENVVVINPNDAERELEQDLTGVHTQEEYERRMAERLERKLASGKDVPLVEHFPLAPEEETPEFLHLQNTLMLRFIRAWEHHKGNTHLTLPEIIVRALENPYSTNPFATQ